MKKLWTVMALMLTMALGAQTVEAKKFGGGKSFGQARQTAPAQPKKTDNAQSAQQTPNKAADAGKKGMLGGLLGGLLVGGLIGSMLGNGAFEGIQFMDILILGLIAFVIFKLLRRRRATQNQSAAFSGMPNTSTPMPREALADTLSNSAAVPQSAGFGSSDIPFNLPAGFDLTAFLVSARDHYRTLQDAWNSNDLDKIREYVSPELYALLAQERAELAGEQHTEVLFVDAELVRADHDLRHAELSIKFSGRYRDTTEAVEEAITDIWHLERDLIMPGAPWLIVGIEG